jgi:hypothetical protein
MVKYPVWELPASRSACIGWTVEAGNDNVT